MFQLLLQRQFLVEDRKKRIFYRRYLKSHFQDQMKICDRLFFECHDAQFHLSNCCDAGCYVFPAAAAAGLSLSCNYRKSPSKRAVRNPPARANYLYVTPLRAVAAMPVMHSLPSSFFAHSSEPKFLQRKNRVIGSGCVVWLWEGSVVTSLVKIVLFFGVGTPTVTSYLVGLGDQGLKFPSVIQVFI
jgi:hypothetical protein